MTYRIDLVGEARVEIAAVGLGDAEQQVEKTVRSRCADCRVDVLEVRRLGRDARIADDYLVTCRIRLIESVDAESRPIARSAVLRRARERFAGTALSTTIWGEPKLQEGEAEIRQR